MIQKVSERHRLDKYVWVKTDFEYLVKKPLIENGVVSLYEPFNLFLGGHKTNLSWQASPKYVPDFLLPYNYKDNRVVAIEPHVIDNDNKKDAIKTIEKMETARKSYGLYIVFISPLKPGKSVVSSDEIRPYVDEFWCDDYNGLKSNGHKSMEMMRDRIGSFLATTEVRQVSGVGNIIDQLRTYDNQN
ncbi:MAG: hypothetical protein ACHQX1_01640 [Candidatus Micrarchaeales archaeon]